MLRGVFAFCAVICITVGAAQAQTTRGPGFDTGVVMSAVLVIDSDRFFTNSEYGKRVATDLEAERLRLVQTKRELEAELEAEERRLLELRDVTPADEFSAMVDVFDIRVQRARQSQDETGRVLSQRYERARAEFISDALPILANILAERRAVAVLERGSVFLSADAIDITDEAIRLADAALGDGTKSD